MPRTFKTAEEQAKIHDDLRKVRHLNLHIQLHGKPSDAEIDAFCKKYGLDHTYTFAFSEGHDDRTVIVAQHDGKQHSKNVLKRVEKDARVMSVEEDVEPEIHRNVLHEPAQPITDPVVRWNLWRMDVPHAWATTKGAGIRFGNMDEGLVPVFRYNNQDFPNIDSPNVAAATGGSNGDGTATWTGSPPTPQTHGACTLQIASAPHNGLGVPGIAPDAELYVEASFDSYAWDWFYARKCDVVTTSVGGPTNVQGTAVAALINKGCIVTASAGNDSLTYPIWAFPSVLVGVTAVGAVEAADNPASYTNYGPFIDLVAPTDWPISAPAGPGWNGSYSIFNGTSASAPATGAVAVLVWSVNPPVRNASFQIVSGFTGPTVIDILRATADPCADSQTATYASMFPNAGGGPIHAGRAVQYAKAKRDGVPYPYLGFPPDTGIARTLNSVVVSRMTIKANVEGWSPTSSPINLVEVTRGGVVVFSAASSTKARQNLTWTGVDGSGNAIPENAPVSVRVRTASGLEHTETYTDLIFRAENLTVEVDARNSPNGVVTLVGTRPAGASVQISTTVGTLGPVALSNDQAAHWACTLSGLSAGDSPTLTIISGTQSLIKTISAPLTAAATGTGSSRTLSGMKPSGATVVVSDAPPAEMPPIVNMLALGADDLDAITAQVSDFKVSSRWGITGYMITQDMGQPAIDDPRWLASPPALVQGAALDVAHSYYPWARGITQVSQAANPTVKVFASVGAIPWSFIGEGSGVVIPSMTVGDFMFPLCYLDSAPLPWAGLTNPNAVDFSNARGGTGWADPMTLMHWRRFDGSEVGKLCVGGNNGGDSVPSPWDAQVILYALPGVLAAGSVLPARAGSTLYTVGQTVTSGGFTLLCTVQGYTNPGSPSVGLSSTFVTDGSVTWAVLGQNLPLVAGPATPTSRTVVNAQWTSPTAGDLVIVVQRFLHSDSGDPGEPPSDPYYGTHVIGTPTAGGVSMARIRNAESMWDDDMGGVFMKSAIHSFRKSVGQSVVVATHNTTGAPSGQYGSMAMYTFKMAAGV